MKRQDQITELVRYLAYLKSQVEIANSLNLTDINKHAEDFYKELLNLGYGFNLVNINIEDQNTAAIDLGDKERRIAIQVTSTASFDKIKKTYATFVKKKLNESYDRLIVLNIREKLSHRTKYLGEEGEFRFDTENDLWDVSSIVAHVGGKTVVEIQPVIDFFHSSVNLGKTEKVAKEVTTFIRLIEVLSDEEQPSAGKGYKEEPDPEGKIGQRFEEHADFLKQQFTELYIEYGAVLTDLMSVSELGHTKIRRLGLYLMSHSDRVLQEKNGNAKEALDFLVRQYCDILSKNAVDYDEGSVRFFLVDQLIKCHVFPNKVNQDG
jgi:hypothetical protein